MALPDRLAFLREVDKLKAILRQTRVTFDFERRENDAEHSWHLAMMAIVLAEYGPSQLDLLAVLRMVLVHDLVEIDAGDTFIYDDAHAASQADREAVAADRIFGMLDEPMRGQLRGAWDEFEANRTPSAKFARAVDRVQPILQNYYTDGASWRAHGITAAQVRAKNGPLGEAGAPAVWAHVETLIDDAVSRGWLKP
ncbi:MAG TPA: HD domain-containing protein [Kofleriaceae bacterium]|jgi:putative hydrolase of HD superfamily|nr:HD domain-containing protein [Kofleriaceae bacterium]